MNAMATPSTSETAVLKEDGYGNFRSLDHVCMEGAEIFNFAMKEVPPLIDHIFKETGESIDSIDYFLFHQPNKYMLKKLSEKINIPKEKLPMDLVTNYGNPSGASIPMAALTELGDKLIDNIFNCCFAGFGSGLAWGGMVIELGQLENCELIVSDL